MLAAAGAVLTLGAVATGAAAQKVDNEVAVFAALDKVTARISRLEIALGQTVRFGTLLVTPRSCYSRPPTEPPKTTAFVEVVDVKLDNSQKAVFSGWMFAESPGLNAVEHPVFDVWLTECSKPIGRRAPATAAAEGAGRGSPAAQPADTVGDEPRRRVRR